jgi:hypothetical protein
MGRRLRFVPERTLVEVTCRTIQGRFLLKPFPGWREIFVGALAKAQVRHPVEIHAFVCLSNHFHLLVSPQDARQLAGFMRHLLSKLSIEAGRRHAWRGPLFQRRYQAILISHETPAQVQRLRYLLAHGVKEHLVNRVADWPGPHCGVALVAGEPVHGMWPNRTRQWLARHGGQKFTPEELEESCTLVLEPLPCWRGSTVEHRRASVREILEEIEAEAMNRRSDGGWPCLGAHAVLKQDPHGGPASSKRSPAPFCHAFTKRARRRLRSAYGLFCAAYREAAGRLAGGDRGASFPEGSFPPPIPFRWASGQAATASG